MRTRRSSGSSREQSRRGVLDALDRILNRGGDADDVLRDVVAALGISGPTSRLSDRLDELGRDLTTRAAQLESVLHGSHPPIAKKGVA